MDNDNGAFHHINDDNDDASSLGDVSDVNDDDSSLDSVRGSFEFLEQQKFVRTLATLGYNSPTATRLDLSYWVWDARDWNPGQLDGPMTIAELRIAHEEQSMDYPTTLECLEQALRHGCAYLTELSLKESILTRFPAPLVAILFQWIAKSTTLQTLKFFGGTYDEGEERPIVALLLQALTSNQSIQSLELRRVPFDNESSFQTLLTKPNSLLRRLDMVECQLEHVSADALADAMARNVGLATLEWQNNRPANRVEALLRGLAQQTGLQDLSLFVHTTMTGGDLGRALAQCRALERFFLFHRRSFHLGADDHFDMTAFMVGLRESTSLRKVALRVQGTTAVATETSPPMRLDEFDLSNCEWSAASRDTLFSSMAQSHTMDLSSNIFRQKHMGGTEVLPSATWSQLFSSSRLQKLDVRNCGLRSGDAQEIARLLAQPHVQVKELDISFNRFGMDDLQTLVDSLANARHLETLGMSGPIDHNDDTTTTTHGFVMVAQVLHNAPKLRTIDLTDTTLFVGGYTEQEERDFIGAVAGHAHLEALLLDGLWLSPRQCRTLLVALGSTQTVKSISARYQNFALYLESIDVSFADVLSGNSALKHLDLEQSTQSPSSIASLLQGIQQHQSLRSVHLGTIDCHESFLGQLCEMLRQNQSVTNLSMRLRKWSLPEMELFYRDLFTCLAEFGTLRELDVTDGVTDHPILRSTGEALLKSLQTNSVLESVSVSLAFLPYELHDKILFYLRLNKLGRKLLLSERTRSETSLWPRALVKMTGYRDIRYLHYFVHDLASSELLVPSSLAR